jgi:hypothetical protein
MNVHIHTMRSYCHKALGLILVVILLGWVYASPSGEIELAKVTGRVTSGGHPLGGTRIVFLETGPRGFMASAMLQADGSFRMKPWGRFGREGVAPGAYRVYFIPKTPGATMSAVDEKYQNPVTSDLLVHVGPGWDDFAFSLPAPRRGPTLAQLLRW